MKRFICADIHVGKSNDDELFDVLYFMLNKAVDERCDTFEILGDLLESRTLLMFRLWPRVKKFFDDLVNTGINIRLLAGNHDFYNTKERTKSNLRQVSLNDKVDIIDTIQQREEVLYLPWLFPDETIPLQDNTKVIFGHLAVNGFHMTQRRREENGVDVDLLKNIPIYLGHFHPPQVLGNVRYLGNIVHSTWNDEGQPKYAYILDDEFEIEQSIILNPYFTNLIKIEYEDIETLEMPEKAKITVLNVPKGEEELVSKALVQKGATSVECLNIDDYIEISDIDQQTEKGLSVDEAIEDQIEKHDMKEELMAFHSILGGQEND